MLKQLPPKTLQLKYEHKIFENNNGYWSILETKYDSIYVNIVYTLILLPQYFKFDNHNAKLLCYCKHSLINVSLPNWKNIIKNQEMYTYYTVETKVWWYP